MFDVAEARLASPPKVASTLCTPRSVKGGNVIDAMPVMVDVTTGITVVAPDGVVSVKLTVAPDTAPAGVLVLESVVLTERASPTEAADPTVKFANEVAALFTVVVAEAVLPPEHVTGLPEQSGS